MTMKYKNEPAFINRQEEMAYLKGWMAERPKQILFLYGPKSSGKTTQMRQNFLYYNPTRAEYKLQGRSMEIGLARYVRDVQMD